MFASPLVRSYGIVGRVAVLGGVAALAAQSALAAPFDSATEFTSSVYALDNGSRGAGSTTLTETGYQIHGAFGSPNAAVGPVRYFQGEAGEAQQAGQHDLVYKNFNGDFEQITHVFPSAGPTTSTTYHGGGNFDGTAIWLTSTRFDAGGAPAVGSTSPPTAGTSPNVVAGGGVDIRRVNSGLTLLDVIDGQVISRSFLMEADVFVPNYGVVNNVHVGGYVDREGFGLAAPGGQAMRNTTFTPDQWNKVQVRYDFTLDGGALAGSSDDSGSLFQTFFVNGVQVGTLNVALNATQMQSRTGPVRFSPSFGIQRGWQGSAVDAFLDNISLFEILPLPELSSTPLAGETIDFGRVALNSTNILTEALELRNTGAPDSQLSISGYSITGPDADLFDVLNFTPTDLVVGGQDSALYDLVFQSDDNEKRYHALLTFHTSLGDVAFNLTAQTIIPEPSAFVLLGLGILGLPIARRRRR